MSVLVRRAAAVAAVAVVALSLPATAHATPSTTLTPTQAVAELSTWVDATNTALAGGFRAAVSAGGQRAIHIDVTAGGATAEITGAHGLHAFISRSRSWVALGQSRVTRAVLGYLHKPDARYVVQDIPGTSVGSPVDELALVTDTPDPSGPTPWIVSADQVVNGATTTLALSVSFPSAGGPVTTSDVVIDADASGVVSHISEAGLINETFAPATVSVHLPSLHRSITWRQFQKGVQAYLWPGTLSLLVHLFAVDAEVLALSREHDKRVHPADIWIMAKRELPGLIKAAPFRFHWVPIRSGVAVISTNPISDKKIDFHVVARHGSAAVVRVS